MILVNNPGSWDAIYPPLQHARWHGCTPTDLVFPFFLFIVGISISFALNKPGGLSLSGPVLYRILKRSLLLFLIGVFLNAFPYFEWSALRIPGVLQRIAIVFFICALLYFVASWRLLVGISISILLVYWLVLYLVPVPGTSITGVEVTGNLAGWIDHQLLEGHLWAVTKTWDPEGVLSTLPAVVTGVVGMLTGKWLQSAYQETDKVIGMFLVGNILVVAGLGWDLVFPINKNLWTSSYVLYTSGIALNFLAGLYWVIDISKHRGWLSGVFITFGVNALFVYILSMLLASLLYTISIGAVSVQKIMFIQIDHILEDDRLSSLVYAMLFVIAMYIPARILYNRNIILKV